MIEKRASLHNLGCKVNAYETDAMEQLLEEAGYRIVPFDQPADVCIINTCSVTNIADKKSRQMLHRAKAKNPQAVVVAAGCYVQAAAETLKNDGAVDIIIGNNKKKELVKILEEYFATHGREDAFLTDIDHDDEYEELHIRRVCSHTRAFIKVQDGCNQFCSYCIIPYTRGRVRSRNPQDVAAEARRLAAAGNKELVLTGIHLSSYGKDFAGNGADGGRDSRKEQTVCGLLDLVRILHEVDGIERIRLGSLEPRIVTPEFARSLAALPKVCPHFHLSLQSGCAETLKRMNRHYTPQEYEQSCRYLREAFGNPAITTDVIVGFPGETEEEFARTREFLSNIHFYEMHIFKYSRRERTRAAVMPDQIDERIKGERSDILLTLEKAMSKEYRSQFIGKTAHVLFEEVQKINGRWYIVGYNREYVKLAMPVKAEDETGVKLTESELCGQLVKGRVNGWLTEEILEFVP